MFERNVIEQLRRWKDKPDRKPLLMLGARQVGKSGLAALLVLMITASCGGPSSDGKPAARDIEILNPDAPLRVSYDELVDSVSYIALDSKKWVT